MKSIIPKRDNIVYAQKNMSLFLKSYVNYGTYICRCILFSSVGFTLPQDRRAKLGPSRLYNYSIYPNCDQVVHRNLYVSALNQSRSELRSREETIYNVILYGFSTSTVLKYSTFNYNSMAGAHFELVRTNLRQ